MMINGIVKSILLNFIISKLVYINIITILLNFSFDKRNYFIPKQILIN